MTEDAKQTAWNGMISAVTMRCVKKAFANRRARLAPKLEPTLAEIRSILAKRGLIEYFQLAAELAALVDRRPK